MANPTNPFSWQMPTASDLVTDLPADFETFGQAVATSMADLLGGTTGQVLSKASNTDMDFTWVTSDDANAIQNTIVDAKGDLISATGSDVPARLAVGANGETLVVDSSTATGLKWAPSVNFRGCLLYNSGTTTQTIPNNVNTIVTFDAESFDTDNFHNNSTNTSRITIPTGLGGKYRFTLNLLWDVNGTGRRATQLYKNGSQILFGADLAATSGLYIGYSYTFVTSAVAGDYFEMSANQTSGAGLALFKRETENPFSCEYLGA